MVEKVQLEGWKIQQYLMVLVKMVLQEVALPWGRHVNETNKKFQVLSGLSATHVS